jgi:mycothiol synthase
MTEATVRSYLDDDAQPILELKRLAASADLADDGLAVSEPPPNPLFSAATPQEDTLVVHDEGQILATAQLQGEIGPQQSFIWAFPTVHPTWQGTRIEGLLLEHLWARASERRSQIRSETVYFYALCGAQQGERIALYEELGLRLMRYCPHMAYHPLDNLAGPEAPPGMMLRPYSRGPDDESAVRTLNEAFADDREYVPLAMDGWKRWLDSPQWRVDLNLVAADGEEVVGLCLCTINEERTQWLGRKDGYVDTLCVRPSHQRRGVGAALLISGLETLRVAGMVSATLDTDADNLTQAPRFYESVGFREIWRWVAYGVELR